MVDPVFWFQFTRSQKEVNKLPELAEDKETEKKKGTTRAGARALRCLALDPEGRD